MSAASALWTRTAVSTAISTAAVLSLAPPQPVARLPWIAAVACGLSCGALLFVGLARRCPRPTRAGHTALTLFGVQGFLALLAANEEIVWRRVVMGELLRIGSATALVASTTGFALMHRAGGRKLQLGTGAAFGTLYLGTGTLAASIAAHWAYNALVASRSKGAT